ncbi:MAG: hypothetical protein NZ578_05635 [Candidatus Binatia bacterium]|nr:hypothetical protein [Candidatus Binatia bacterium]
MVAVPPHSDPPSSQPATLQQRFEHLNETSSREAAALAAQGIRCRWWWLVVCPVGALLRTYLGHGEWRHGIGGLITACFAAYAVFVRYAKLWELQHVRPLSAPPPEHR